MGSVSAILRARERLRAYRRLGLSVVYERATVVLLALGATLPLYLLPGQTGSPRLGDLALGAALPLLVLRWPTLAGRFQLFCLFGVVLLAVVAGLQALSVEMALSLPQMVFWFRWFASICAASLLAHLVTRRRRRLDLFAKALILGSAAHVATFGLALVIGREVLEGLGLASPRSAITTVFGHARLSTLAEHPNAAMTMIGLAVPACLMLRRASASLWRPPAAAVVLIGFFSTLSRGGLVAAAASVVARVFVAAAWRRTFHPLAPLLAFCAVTGGLLAVQLLSLDMDISRFVVRLDERTLEANFTDRLMTWGRGIAFSIQFPLGVGWVAPEDLGAARALTVSHNSYIFIARTLGAVAALAVLGLHLTAAARLDAVTPLCVFVLAASLNEDLSQGAGFVLLIALVAALALRRRTAP